MGKIKSLLDRTKKALRTNRVLRTFIQAVGAYIAVNIPLIVEGEIVASTALETVLVGAIAAGFSAIWKTDEINK